MVEFLNTVCYNTDTCGIGISVLCGLPKAKRRVRLPYPAPKKKDRRSGGLSFFAVGRGQGNAFEKHLHSSGGVL